MDKRILACKGADPERIVIKEVAYGVSAQKRATAVCLTAGKNKRAARMQELPGIELFYNYFGANICICNHIRHRRRIRRRRSTRISIFPV